MGPNYIALAIPLFMISIVVEILVARARRRELHRFSDVVSDLSCGMFQQVGIFFFNAALVAGYAFFWERDRLWDLPVSSATAWIVALIGVDFLYYWWHRMSHEVNILWAAHVVHHSSEDYNLAVALRQALTTELTAFPFYLPLALVGVPPLVFVTAHSLNTLYQFWIHTELVNKIGPFERFANTPSHHRVHHAINPQYLDKNYGGILILWDRLFGTFAEERERPIYGITKPLASFNILWAQFHYWAELARDAWRAPYLADKVKIWFASPAWHPRGLPLPPGRDGDHKFDAPITMRKVWAIAVVLVAAVGGTFLLLQYEPALTTAQQATLVLSVMLALLVCSLLIGPVRKSGVAS